MAARVAGVPSPFSLSASFSCSSSTSLPAVSIAPSNVFSVKCRGGEVSPCLMNGSCGPVSPRVNAGSDCGSSPVFARGLFKLGPARPDDPNTAGAKRHFVGHAVDRRDLFQARGIKCRDEPRHHGIKDLLLGRRQVRREGARRDDRVVVGNLAVVHDAAGER